MGTEAQSATRRLADHLIGGGLEPYVEVRRHAGKSWRRISLELRDEFALDITHETLRNWFPQYAKIAKAGAA